MSYGQHILISPEAVNCRASVVNLLAPLKKINIMNQKKEGSRNCLLKLPKVDLESSCV